MKRQLLYLVLIFSGNILSYSYTDEYLARCAEERILDSITVSFAEIEGGERFIEKFSLNKEELKMIGIWGFDNSICMIPEDRKYGPGLTIKFYPNRCFQIYKENEKIGQIKNIFGEWKVEDGRLFIKFISKLMIINKTGTNKYTKYRGEYLNNDIFYSIFTVPEYNIAFVNKEAFDWSEVPLSITAYFDFKNDDKPRSRLLLDPLGDPPGDLREGGKVGDLLFYPCLYEEKYLIDLSEVW